MDNIDNLTEYLIKMLMDKGPSVLMAIITLVVGWWLTNFFVRAIKKAMTKKGEELGSLSHFFGRIINITLKVLLILSVASMIGIQTTSFMAIIGTAGLAIGLALQGSLANFAGGVLIIILKPFKIGDFIDANGHLGTVNRIDIFNTTINTPDNKLIVIPNGALSNAPITNYSAQEIRRVEIKIGISYKSDIKLARKIIIDSLNKDERILKDPEPKVLLTELADSSLNLSVRAWVNTDNFWPVYWDNIENIKEELDKGGVEIPFPQRDVHIFNH